MIRARFYIKKSDCGNDYRPVKWPIKSLKLQIHELENLKFEYDD